MSWLTLAITLWLIFFSVKYFCFHDATVGAGRGFDRALCWLGHRLLCAAAALWFATCRERGSERGRERATRGAAATLWFATRTLRNGVRGCRGDGQPGHQRSWPTRTIGWRHVTGLGMLQAVLFGRECTTGGRRTSNYLETEVLATGEAHMYGRRPIDQGVTCHGSHWL